MAGVALDQPLPVYEPPQTNLTPEQKYLANLLAKNGYNGNGAKPTVIVVHKLSRKLTFYQGLTPLKTYSVVLGNDPHNDKLCQGDTCTPEGVYHVRAKYPHSRWDYFIWLDYPNTQNWLKFARAKKAGRLPPDADIGGDVGIHGTEDPTRNLSGLNWTQGLHLSDEQRPGRDLPVGERQDPGGHREAIAADPGSGTSSKPGAGR